MLKNEFFDRTGLQVSDNEYARIDSMYNYCSDMDKDKFCVDYKKHKDSTILNTYVDMYFNANRKLKHLNDERNEVAMFIIAQAEELDVDSMRDMAIKLVGFKKYAKEVIRMGYSLRGKYRDQMIDLLDN